MGKNLESAVEYGPEQERTKAERQPENDWRVEQDEYMLEIVHVTKSGATTTLQEKYTPEPNGRPTEIEVALLRGDAKMEISPYHLQVFGIKVPALGIVEASLHVGVIDEERVSFIAIKRKAENNETLVQYFFRKDGTPGSYHTDRYHFTSWQRKNPHVLSDGMFPDFSKLASTLSPKASRSLLEAVTRLA